MFIKTLILFNVGNPFGGFRFVIRADFLKTKQFKLLESLAEEVFDKIKKIPFEERENKIKECEQSEKFKDAMGFSGYMDFLIDDGEKGEKILINRAYIPFSFFGIGGYAIYSGLKTQNDGVSIRLSHNELMKYR